MTDHAAEAARSAVAILIASAAAVPCHQSRRKFITRFLVSARVSERARPSFLTTRATEIARTDSD